MQVHLYRDDDRIYVEIPTSDGVHKASVAYDELDVSDDQNPCVVTMPDFTGSTQYARRVGEMPLKLQEEHTRAMHEDLANQAQREASQATAAPQVQPQPQAQAGNKPSTTKKK